MEMMGIYAYMHRAETMHKLMAVSRDICISRGVNGSAAATAVHSHQMVTEMWRYGLARLGRVSDVGNLFDDTNAWVGRTSLPDSDGEAKLLQCCQ